MGSTEWKYNQVAMREARALTVLGSQGTSKEKQSQRSNDAATFGFLQGMLAFSLSWQLGD